jgi:hypothetical protein
MEAITQKQRCRIEVRRRQRALDREYGRHAGGLRWSAHWLGVGLERLGTALQVKQHNPVQVAATAHPMHR